MKLSLLALAALVLVTGCASAPRCELPAAVELWSQGPPHEPNGRRLARYDLDDAAIWWQEALPESTTLASFRERIRALPGVDLAPMALLERAQSYPTDEATAENLRVAQALAGAAVRPMRCLEGAILATQTDRLDMVDHPSEVLAYILRSRDGRRLRVYTLTVNSAGIGGVGRINDAALPDLEGGQWRLVVALHNHNFFVGAPNLGGVVAPSAPDVELLRGLHGEYGTEAWITNGFHTASWDGAALARFRGPDAP